MTGFTVTGGLRDYGGIAQITEITEIKITDYGDRITVTDYDYGGLRWITVGGLR